jgi:hypothetical protein
MDIRILDRATEYCTTRWEILDGSTIEHRLKTEGQQNIGKEQVEYWAKQHVEY